MLLLHTADWHLGDRLGRLDRTDDLFARVARVASICDERGVDVLVLAGDVFSEQAGVEAMTACLDRIRTLFASFFARGGTFLAVTGNHDRDSRVEMIRAGMSLAVPASSGGRLSRGRMYIVNGPFLGTLEDAGGLRVQFALVPYPTRSRYIFADDEFTSREEEYRLLTARVTEWVNGVPESSKFDTSLPTVLVAHLHVRGAEVHRLYKLDARDDMQFEAGDVGGCFAYAALGHIHKPQAVGGRNSLRYPGPLDRLDFGEADDDRGVLLVTINATGLGGDPEWVPLPPTPFYAITLRDPDAELPTLAEMYPDRETAIVKVRVPPGPAGPMSRDEVQRRLRDFFPRLHELVWEPGDPLAAPPEVAPEAEDYRAVVRRYLESCLAGDPDRGELLSLAESFFSESPR